MARFFNEEDREDFEQYVALKTIEGRKATRWQLYVDYLRQHRGDPRTKQFELKSLSKKVYEYHEDRPSLAEDEMRNNSGGALYSSWKSFEELIRGTSRIERQILRLIYIWGFSETEIANIYELDISRIGQIKKKAQARILQAIQQDKEKALNGGPKEETRGLRETEKAIGKIQAMGSFLLHEKERARKTEIKLERLLL